MRGSLRAAVVAGVFFILISAGLAYAMDAAQSPEGTLTQPATSPEGTAYKYIGIAKCGMCHINPKRIWLETKHAKAFETLSSDESKKYSQNPATDPKCLKCHVTGYNQAGGYVIPTAGDAASEALAKSMEGVQCEMCHGAGEKYKTVSIMKDKALAQQNGLIMPTEEVCLKCHNNKENPTFVEGEWDFKAHVEKIKHTK